MGDNSHDTRPMATVGYTATAVAGTALLVRVLTAQPGARVRRILEAGWARYLGARSYGIYVWHSLVFSRMVDSGVVDRTATLVPGRVLRGTLFSVLAFAIAITVSEISWRVLEAPVLRLKRFVPRPTPAEARQRVTAVAVAPAA